jgi:diketogulonate reductase-like aldo/keto reductase
MIKRWMRDDVLTRVQELQPLAEEVGLSMAALAVAWVLQNDNVATAIIGASRPEQVHDNVKAAGVRLPAEVMTRIDKILDPVIERDPAKTLRAHQNSARPDRLRQREGSCCDYPAGSFTVPAGGQRLTQG